VALRLELREIKKIYNFQHQVLQYEHLSQMAYTDALIKEALRLDFTITQFVLLFTLTQLMMGMC
jgi:hypothetical protein